MPDARRVGDYGQALNIAVSGVDVTQATSRKIVIRKPTGARLEWTPSSFTASQVNYTFLVGDLDIPGTYVGEVELIFSTLKYTTDSFAFVVHARV